MNLRRAFLLFTLVLALPLTVEGARPSLAAEHARASERSAVALAPPLPAGWALDVAGFGEPRRSASRAGGEATQTTATLAGRIVDSSGGALPGVTVTIR